MKKSKVNELPKLEDVKDAKFTPVTEGVTVNAVGGSVDENLEIANEIATSNEESAEETANENVTAESEKELVVPQPTEEEVSAMENGIYESGIDPITSENGSVSDIPTIETSESSENYTLGNSDNVSVTAGVALETLALESKKANTVVESEWEDEVVPDKDDLIELKMEFNPVTHREKDFLTTTHNGDLVYLPLENVVKEGENVYIPYWLYKIKFK